MKMRKANLREQNTKLDSLLDYLKEFFKIFLYAVVNLPCKQFDGVHKKAYNIYARDIYGCTVYIPLR